MNRSIKEIIEQRRRQILVHSHLYYELDSAYIADNVFDLWCRDLKELQYKYPEISRECIYFEAFKEFDGNSGFDLPYNLPEIKKKAEELLKYR